MYLSKSKTTSKNYTSAKKNILLLLDTLNVQSMPDSISIYQSLSLSVFTVSAFPFLTLTPNIPIFFNTIPQRIISIPIHCFGYTALL